ncbi:hypothetical protein SDC9_164196 [bioreactor metagenome]|uniref:Uncharacterized protein n=1 Tax=bioreactor metagenome TaxID=1076179 RepID=A0A645FTQ2_9ZZZZ
MKKSNAFFTLLTIIFIIMLFGVNNITSVIYYRKVLIIIFAFLALISVIANLLIYIKVNKK